MGKWFGGRVDEEEDAAVAALVEREWEWMQDGIENVFRAEPGNTEIRIDRGPEYLYISLDGFQVKSSRNERLLLEKEGRVIAEARSKTFKRIATIV